MIKLIIILSLLSCYDKGIKKLSNLFKRGNTSIDNRIEYKVEKNVKLEDEYNQKLCTFKANLTYIKDLNKDELIVKNENNETLVILKNNRLILKNSEEIVPASNSTMELVYNMFLYSSLELNKILEILNVNNYEKNEIGSNLVRIEFDRGYVIYDVKDKIVKELSDVMYHNNIKLDNKVLFNYKTVNRMLILNKFIWKSIAENKILTIEEEMK